MNLSQAACAKQPWNKGKTVGQKAPVKPKEIWAIRTRLEMDGRTRDLAFVNSEQPSIHAAHNVATTIRSASALALRKRDGVGVIGPSHRDRPRI